MKSTSLMTTWIKASSGTLTILSGTMKLRESCCLRRHQGTAYHQAIRSSSKNDLNISDISLLLEQLKA